MIKTEMKIKSAVVKGRKFKILTLTQGSLHSFHYLAAVNTNFKHEYRPSLSIQMLDQCKKPIHIIQQEVP